VSVILVETGLANTASVAAALHRAGAAVTRSADPELIRRAERVVLPGVGHYGAGVAMLRETGVDRAIADRFVRGAPTLGVCLGMQLLFEGSEEAPDAPGLGLLPGRLRRFAPGLQAPRLGWGAVTQGEGTHLLNGGAAYFAHSYYLPAAPSGWAEATSSHGAPYVAALERGAWLLCQLHPELSGAWGLDLLGRWLRGEAAVAQAPGRVGPRIIPCLDVSAGRVVKGVKFAGLRDAGDPVEQARSYAEQGADELVILDVSATVEARASAAETVAAVRAVLPLPLTVGGGVRAPEDAARLLASGADKVAVNTAAVEDPSLIARISERFGAQCCVVAIDAARRLDGPGWEVVTRAGRNRTGIDAVEWAAEAERRGAGELLLTSFDRDGTGEGYDLPLLRAVRAAQGLPLIASGGARTPAHLAAALEAGADAVLAATIFHDGHLRVSELKAALFRDHHIEVRR
jgi:imidazole glycerol phosphate synthase glutamine amidotransferase subunit